MGALPQLQAEAGLPLYRQLKLWLLERIHSGEWPQETALPSERRLSAMLHISRATVRQAVDELEREGWLAKKRGKGTFVAPVKVEQPLARLSGFTANMRQAGVEPSSKVLKAELEEPSARVARALQLPPGSVVAIITRLRLADGEPLMIERSHLNYALTPRLLEHDLSGSLYSVLTEIYRLKLATGEESLEVVGAEPWMARMLEVSGGAPLLYTERVVADEKGTPLEFAQRYARADKCRFRVALVGDNAQFALKETVDDPPAYQSSPCLLGRRRGDS